MVARIFLHGPGGSGKTYMLTRVILPVYEYFLPRASKGVAAQNSAARLIAGATFHYMAALTRGQDLGLQKPTRARRDALRRRWLYVALAFLDEISLTPPALLAVLNDSAHWGRESLNTGSVRGCGGSVPGDGDIDHELTETLGNILCQIIAGDFLQLNPVLNHSLMEIFGVEVPRAPTYERMDEQSRQRKRQIDQKGLDIFGKFLPQTILFRGSHRFKAGDPLAAILNNMRQEGFHPLSSELKDLIRKQVFRPLAGDPRLDSNFVMRDHEGRQVGPVGFFANGMFSAINWDQVARLQQITVYESAKNSFGVTAFKNTANGCPVRFLRHFPAALGRSFNFRFGRALEGVADVLTSFLFAKGQVIFYAQAVDLVHQKEYFNDKTVLRECLAITNMASKTCNLMSFCPLHVGLRVKITKKLMAPELVQECPAEIIAIHVHPEERYGIPGCPPGLQQPPSGHPCWTEGVCRLDFLPASITLRVEARNFSCLGWRNVFSFSCVNSFRCKQLKMGKAPCVKKIDQDIGDDYTGECMPGVWHLDPIEDSFTLRIRRRGEVHLNVTRVQYPLAPWMAGTYNNQQGKTVRNMGHTIDFNKPDYFTTDEYVQHVYMILGRATCLEWSLFRNLPMLEDGSDIDFTVFEHGPPGYIAQFLKRLEDWFCR